jgi:hypothetical protein
MSIANHLKLCRPLTEDNQVISGAGLNALDWPDIFEYQGFVAAPMVDFHSGNITAIACTDGIGRVSYVGNIKPRQCGFYAGSIVKHNELVAAFAGCEKPLIFCTDLITSLLLNRITGIPVMFCTDVSAFRFSGATECYIKSQSQTAIRNALHACGAVDVWFPVGNIEQTRHVKWMDALQAASLIEVEHG